MAASPDANSAGVLTLELKSNDKALDPEIGVLSVRIQKRANRIASATIELVDDDVPKQDFPLSNSSEFEPGAEIAISAGYGGDADLVFEGIVVRHGVRVSGEAPGRLVVECRDKAAAMTVGRKNARYEEKTDSEVLKSMLDAAGVDGKVEQTTARYPELVQYYCSDWDFLLVRADANGLLVLVEDGEVRIESPATDAQPALTVTYGKDLIAFEANADARTQLAKVETAAWDAGQQQVVTSQASPGGSPAQGDLTASKLSGVLDLSAYRLQTSARADESQLQTWAKSRCVKSDLARIQGCVRFRGNARATLGSVIELVGVGDHFSGKVQATGVRHEIEPGSWTTEVEFGLSPEPVAQQHALAAPPASGLVPGIRGLQIGVVQHLQDPDGEHRVQVTVPLLAPEGQPQGESLWARLGHSYASDGFGSFFYPEVGDEVVLGFLNEDPANPVVLGSLYSSKRKPACELGGEEDANDLKALFTRSQLKLEFDEEKKSITITTPAENRITLSDDEKSIVAEDQNGNRVELTPDGISLDSPKDIQLKAQGGISIEATSDVSIKGLNVSAEANSGLTAKGNASAEVSAAGNTTIKGAMVMIN